MKLVYIIVLIVATVLLTAAVTREKFGIQRFETYDDTEFRGMNLLGVNSLDTHIGASCEKACQNLCAEKNSCVGYSWYQPGHRCYIYGSGGFVFGRKGFRSGMKV